MDHEDALLFISDSGLRGHMLRLIDHLEVLDETADIHEQPNCSIFYRTIAIYNAALIECVLEFYVKQKITKVELKFYQLVEICREQGLLSKKLAGKIKNIEEMRNKIHLSNLKEMDEVYSKEEAKKTTLVMLSTMDAVEKKLITLNKNV